MEAMATNVFYQFNIFIDVLVAPPVSFVVIMIMGLRPLYFFNSFSAGVDFGRHNLTTTDVRF